MDTCSCRLLPYLVADGPTNMARDEALLDLMTDEPGAVVFRTYGWSKPTLSLGYFQTVAEAEADPRWRGVPIVRRPTGGGALWHDLEVTYALAVPKGHPLSRRTPELYQVVHDAIAGLLIGLGIQARRRGESDARTEGARPFLCFTDRDSEDVVVGASKVVGSAQRRRAGAILQHGSLLVSRSTRTPELPGAADLGAISPDAATWSELLAGRVPEALGLVLWPESWPISVETRANELAENVYRNPSWTLRR